MAAAAFPRLREGAEGFPGCAATRLASNVPDIPCRRVATTMLKQHLSRAAAALSLTLAAASTQATPLQLIFTNCGLQANCSGDSAILASFVVDGALSAPAVPAPGSMSAISVISPCRYSPAVGTA